MIDMTRIREMLAESAQRKVDSTQVNMWGGEISRSNAAGSHLAKFPSEQRRHSNIDIFISDAYDAVRVNLDTVHSSS